MNAFCLKKPNLSRELSSVGRDIALYMQMAGIRTPVIQPIYSVCLVQFMGGDVRDFNRGEGREEKGRNFNYLCVWFK
jgi:hypothetical protein